MTNLSGTNLHNGAAVGPQGEVREGPSTFPKYPAYKNSGVEWLEKVPAGWTVSKLGYFFREPPCYGVLVPDFDPDGVPMLRITDMEHEFIDASGLVTISPSLSAQYARTIVQVGDVVLSLVGTIGKAFEVSPKLAGVNLSRAVARIQLGSNTLSRYLCWIFQSCEFTHFIDLVCKGTAQRVLNLSDLNAFSFTFPSYSEQCAISRFLDHETARIDALIEEQQRLIELLKEKRQAVISHAVTKGLDPTVPMKDSGVEWLGEVPAHWEVKQLKHVVDPNSSITYGIVQAGPEFEGGVPYIRTSDMSGEELPVSGYPLTSPDIDESYARSRVRPGDIVMSIRASVGKCLPVPEELKIANLTQGTAKISAGKHITRNFLLTFLNAGATQNYFDLMAKGATFKEITLDALRRTPVLLPPANEQIEIDQFVARHAGFWDETCKKAIQSVSLLQERRSALISAAVTGKIDVRGWRPSARTQAPKFEVAEAV